MWFPSLIPRNGIVYTISSLMFIKQVRFFVMISYLFFLSISHKLNGFYSRRFTVQGHLNFFRVVKVIILARNMLFHRRKHSIWHQYQWKKKSKQFIHSKFIAFTVPVHAPTHPLHTLSERSLEKTLYFCLIAWQNHLHFEGILK